MTALSLLFAIQSAAAAPYSVDFERASSLRQGTYRSRDDGGAGCARGELTFRNVTPGQIDLVLGSEVLARHVGGDVRWTDANGCAKRTVTTIDAGQVEIATENHCAGELRRDLVLILVTSGGFTYRTLSDGRSLICALIRL